MTLEDFWSRIESVIGLSSTTAGTEQDLVTAWVNAACIEFLKRTKCKVTTFTMNTVANQGDYTLDSGVLFLQQLWFVNADSSETPLEPISPEDMIWLRRTSGVEPVRYYALQGSDFLMLYPTPTSTGPLDGIQVPMPTALSASGDDPSTSAGIPAEFHESALLQYVLWQAADYDDDTSSAVGQRYQQNWIAALKDARADLRRKSGRRRAPAVAGRSARRRRYIPRYPSQDTGA